MENKIRVHAQHLKETLNKTNKFTKEYREQVNVPSDLLEMFMFQVEDYIYAMAYDVESIAEMTNQMEQTFEEWEQEQVNQLFLQVDHDARKVDEILDYPDREKVSYLIKDMLNETKYKQENFHANKNDVRGWLFRMIKIFPHLIDHKILVYDRDFNLKINIKKDK